MIDLAAGARSSSISGLEEPQGLFYDAASKRLFVATGGDGACRVYDAAAAPKPLSTIALGEDADNVRFAPATNKIYVGYGGASAGALGIIDAATLKHEGDIAVAGHPESFQLEREGTRIIVNIPTARRVSVADRERRAVTANWPLEDLAQNFPMALDEKNHRLFVGCRKPAALQVVDTTNGKNVARLTIGGDTDDLFYDTSTARLYVCCGEGRIDVLKQLTPDRYETVGSVKTAPGARTALFVPALGRLYVAAPRRDGPDAEILVYEAEP